MLPLEGNEEIIDLFRKGVKNGSYRKAEDIRRMLDELDDGHGNDDRGSIVSEERQTNISDGEVLEGESKGDRRGNLGRSTEDIEGRKYRLSDILGIVDEQSKEDVLAEFLEVKIKIKVNKKKPFPLNDSKVGHEKCRRLVTEGRAPIARRSASRRLHI